MEETRQMLAAKFQAVFPHLDERQRRVGGALGNGSSAARSAIGSWASTTTPRNAPGGIWTAASS
jgi:hypothetical protein